MRALVSQLHSPSEDLRQVTEESYPMIRGTNMLRPTEMPYDKNVLILSSVFLEHLVVVSLSDAFDLSVMMGHGAPCSIVTLKSKASLRETTTKI